MKQRKVSLLIRILAEAWENVDAVVGIILGVVGAIIAAFGAHLEFAIGALGAGISFIAFTVLKDRKGRFEIIQEVKQLNPLSADEVLVHLQDDKSLITTAEKELVLVQETGGLLSESHRDEIKAMLARGGSVRWIVAQSEPSVLRMLAFRNAELNHSKMTKRFDHASQMIDIIVKPIDGHNPLSMVVRYLRYPVDFTAIFKDPTHPLPGERRAQVRLQGFCRSFNQKLSMQLRYTEAPRAFISFAEQMECMWRKASRCVFISAPPRGGKTTMLANILKLPELGRLKKAGFLTHEMLDSNGDRTGFEAEALSTGKRIKIASKAVTGYTLMQAELEQLVQDEFSRADANLQLFVLDEFGPIQLQNAAFRSAVSDLLEKTHINILGSVASVCTRDIRELPFGARIQILQFNSSEERLRVEHLLTKEYSNFE